MTFNASLGRKIDPVVLASETKLSWVELPGRSDIPCVSSVVSDIPRAHAAHFALVDFIAYPPFLRRKTYKPTTPTSVQSASQHPNQR